MLRWSTSGQMLESCGIPCNIKMLLINTVLVQYGHSVQNNIKQEQRQRCKIRPTVEFKKEIKL